MSTGVKIMTEPIYQDDDRNDSDRVIKLISGILIKTPAFNYVITNVTRCIDESPILREPLCMLITGESGVGKSTIISAIEKKHPKTIHEEYNEIPVLTAEIPNPATIKALYGELLIKLGAGYLDKGSVEERRSKLLHQLQLCRVRLIILDEFQHLVERGTKNRIQAVADAIKTLINKSRIPIILVGTPAAAPVLELSPQLSGRFPLREHISAFNWLVRPNEFEKLLLHYEKALPFEMPSGFCDGWNPARIYLATGGYFRVFTTLIREAALIASKYESPRIELQHLAASFDKVLRASRKLRGNPFSMEDREIERWIATLREAQA